MLPHGSGSNSPNVSFHDYELDKDDRGTLERTGGRLARPDSGKWLRPAVAARALTAPVAAADGHDGGDDQAACEGGYGRAEHMPRGPWRR